MLKYFLIEQSSTYVMAVKMVCYNLYNILALKDYCGMNVYTVVNNQTKNLAQVPQRFGNFQYEVSICHYDLGLVA